jgi:hypothetical protein
MMNVIYAIICSNMSQLASVHSQVNLGANECEESSRIAQTQFGSHTIGDSDDSFE